MKPKGYIKDCERQWKRTDFFGDVVEFVEWTADQNNVDTMEFCQLNRVLPTNAVTGSGHHWNTTSSE